MRVPERAPGIGEILSTGILAGDRVQSIWEAAREQTAAERYMHWDDLRHRTPPLGLTREEWWAGIKLSRASLYKPVALTDKTARPFEFCLPDLAQRRLLYIDQNMSGQIVISEEVTNASTRDRYIVSSLIEEAITSSQLEGAATTHQVAKEMIRSGRSPRDKSERMILNNYRAMQRVRELRDEPLTPALVLELHKIVSRDTLLSREAEGRLQTPDDDRVLIWTPGIDPRVLHQPPAAAELPKRLADMCAFANGGLDTGFMHPVIRAIILHFWLAYDHPFEDGNGRTARTLFYWSMLHQNYWLAEFVPISRVLRRAPVQYAQSFLRTETDDNDLTYFLLYNLKVIEKAIRDLHIYLRDKITEIRDAEQYIRETVGLNHRQIALLGHAMRHPGHVYTIESHKRSHNVVYQTARTDLLALEAKGYLDTLKLGRALGFTPSQDLSQRVKQPMRPHAPHLVPG